MRWTMLDFKVRAHVLSFLHANDRKRVCGCAFLNAVDPVETLLCKLVLNTFLNAGNEARLHDVLDKFPCSPNTMFYNSISTTVQLQYLLPSHLAHDIRTHPHSGKPSFCGCCVSLIRGLIARLLKGFVRHYQ